MNRKQKARIVGFLILIVAPAIIGGYLGWTHPARQIRTNVNRTQLNR